MVTKTHKECNRCAGFLILDRYDDSRVCLNCGWRDEVVDLPEVFNYKVGMSERFLDPMIDRDRLIMKRFLSMCPGTGYLVYDSKSIVDVSGRVRNTGTCSTCCKIVSATSKARSHKHKPPLSLQYKIWEHLNWSAPLSRMR